MAIVNSTLAALSSGDRYNLINQQVFWEIQDNHAHRVVEMFSDETEARAAYAKLTNETATQ